MALRNSSAERTLYVRIGAGGTSSGSKGSESVASMASSPVVSRGELLLRRCADINTDVESIEM
jgi:hypothetical protein